MGINVQHSTLKRGHQSEAYVTSGAVYSNIATLLLKLKH